MNPSALRESACSLFKVGLCFHQISVSNSHFLSDPGVPGPIYGSSCLSLRHLCADLTDVTLADEDINSILTDNANRAFQGNVAM